MLTINALNGLTPLRIMELLNDRQWLRGAYLHAWTHHVGHPKSPCSVADLRPWLRNFSTEVNKFLLKNYKGHRAFVTLDHDVSIGINVWADKWQLIDHNCGAEYWSIDRLHKHDRATLYFGLVIPICPEVLSLALALVADGTFKVAADSQKVAMSLATSLNDQHGAPVPPPPPPPPLEQPVAPAAPVPPCGFAVPRSISEPVKISDTIQSEVYIMNNAQSVTIQTNARRVVLVRIMDNDPALLVEHAHVFDSGAIVTESDDMTTIMQALTDYDINSEVARHNAIRATLTDETILRTTGQDVKLRPVKLKDLQISVVRV